MPECLHTHRLTVAPALSHDSEFIAALWNHPAVMTHVGFPDGLGVTPEDIQQRLREEKPSLMEYLLAVRRKDTGTIIGQAMMHAPSRNGICETDIKLMPAFQGQGYGTEIKRALVDYLFTETSCRAVQASPNVTNIPSIRMQETVGAVRLGRGRCQFHPGMTVATHPVDYWLYRCYKNTPEFTDIRHRQFRYAALVPAAGRASRMGRIKQLLPWPPDGSTGMSVIESTVHSLLLAGCDPVIIITGHAGESVREVLSPWPVSCAENSDSLAPMGSSVHIGMVHLDKLLENSTDTHSPIAVMLLPGDHPGVDPDTIRSLIEAHETRPNIIHLPRHHNRTGHPALFPPDAHPYLLDPDPHNGVRGLIHSGMFEVMDHSFEDPGIHINLDTPEDYRRRS
ncbi:MAG TPA: GNAT family N-acetyltransferase [bacterium]|nr:GNAT family N-acetyltransferase [bacterium]